MSGAAGEQMGEGKRNGFFWLYLSVHNGCFVPVTFLILHKVLQRN